jgi:hypothetical protein
MTNHYNSQHANGIIYYTDDGGWWQRHTDAPESERQPVLLLDVLVGVSDTERSSVLAEHDRIVAESMTTLHGTIRHALNAEPEPAARLFDPATSHAAARSVNRDRLRDTQRAILTMLVMRGGMTDEEIAKAWAANMSEQVSPSGLRTRRSELVNTGRVKDSGERRKLATGRSAIVWVAA